MKKATRLVDLWIHIWVQSRRNESHCQGECEIEVFTKI